jgi:hypothetical protein
MKVLVLLPIVLVVFVSMASATPLCTSGGTMASYVALGGGGCSIGDLLFSNFLYGSTGARNGVAVSAASVFLTPVGSGTFNPGIIFSSSGWVVPSASPTGNSFVDSSIAFSVSVIGGSPVIDDGTLTLAAFSVSGTGVANITESINPAGIQLQVDSSGPLLSHGSVAPTNSLSVLKDVLIFVPPTSSGAGSGQISSFEEDFSEIPSTAPEPSSFALLGTGLGGLALAGLRRNRRA